MKISASLYSNKNRALEELVTDLDRCQIEYFHIDCNDDHSVFSDIKKIREISDTPIDLHIISDDPASYFQEIEETKPELVTFQFENIPGHVIFPQIEGDKYGLSVISDTSIEVFDEYKEQCDFILIMTTTPGQSGGTFRKDNFKRIRKFRTLFPGKGIHVDGGVNDETGFILRMLGVSSVVSGSFLVNHESIGEALLHLRSSVIHSDFKVKDFMMDVEDAPTLNQASTTVSAIIEKIDEGNLGFTVITNEDGTLWGLSSNADIRKGLLKNLNDFNAITVDQVVNKKPVFINEEATISELLALIKSKNFLISYLPVLNKERKLTGALSFINLIRSES